MFPFFTFRTKGMLSSSSHFTEVKGRSGGSFRSYNTSTEFHGAFFPRCFHANWFFFSNFIGEKYSEKRLDERTDSEVIFLLFMCINYEEKSILCKDIKTRLKLLLENLMCSFCMQGLAHLLSVLLAV